MGGLVSGCRAGPDWPLLRGAAGDLKFQHLDLLEAEVALRAGRGVEPGQQHGLLAQARLQLPHLVQLGLPGHQPAHLASPDLESQAEGREETGLGLNCQQRVQVFRVHLRLPIR